MEAIFYLTEEEMKKMKHFADTGDFSEDDDILLSWYSKFYCIETCTRAIAKWIVENGQVR